MTAGTVPHRQGAHFSSHFQVRKQAADSLPSENPPPPTTAKANSQSIKLFFGNQAQEPRFSTHNTFYSLLKEPAREKLHKQKKKKVRDWNAAQVEEVDAMRELFANKNTPPPDPTDDGRKNGMFALFTIRGSMSALPVP